MERRASVCKSRLYAYCVAYMPICLGANATSGTQAFDRINELRYRLVDRGIKAIALQPHWCVLRPGECDLDA